MSSIESLIEAYARFVRLPWDRTVSGEQKVWFALYEPTQERRLRFRVPEFETATKLAGHSWRCVDLTDTFAHWMAHHDYREEYFAHPEDMEYALDDFATHVVDEVKRELEAPEIGEDSLVALCGLASLFGLMRASALMERVAPAIRGRLLVFFPGHHEENNNYRLLDARDGWNYHAVPIAGTDGV